MILEIIIKFENLQLVQEMITDDPCFKNYYKMISIDLIKKQTLDVDPKAIQQISFTGNLDRDGCAIIMEEPNDSILDFSQGPMRLF